MVVCSLKVFLLFICLVAAVEGYVRRQQQQCGRTPIPPNIQAKIVGGRLAKPYSWPWQIVYCVYGLFGAEKRCDLDCGGTIIGENWIMTAGHCVEGYSNQTATKKIRIITGVFDEVKRNEPGEVVHKIKAIYRHPLFYMNTTGLGYDIALIEFSDPIKFDDHTQPVCLPTQDTSTIVESNTAWTTGWGKRNFSIGGASHMLRQVNVPFVNYKLCEKEYPGQIVEKVMICAGRVGKDSCSGDSGGPLVVKNGDAWFQYGITSFGFGCAVKNEPGIYSRVSSFCDFIETTTKGSVNCQNPDSYA